MAGHIFISYSRQDGINYAERLEADLKRLGYEVWRDKTNMEESTSFSIQLERAIENASYVVVCVTPSITRKDKQSFVNNEISYARVVEPRPIIPLKFPNAKMPILIVDLTWIPFAEGKPPEEQLKYEDGFAELIQRLEADEHQSRPVSIQDPYRDYLNSVYHSLVDYLGRTVTHEIAVTSRAQQDVVDPPPDPLANPLAAFFYQAGVEETSAVYSNFEQAFHHYAGRVLLLGAPGSGKTTTLLAFARDVIGYRFAQADDTLLPVILPISAWNPGRHTSMLAWIEDAIPFFKQPGLPPLSDLYAQGKLLLILDGLDELLHRPDAQGEDIRYQFMRMLPDNNQVVVSCRIQDYEALGEKLRLKGAVVLQPLTNRQIHDYLESIPDLWATLTHDAELLELARTPLVLNLLTSGYAQARDEFLTHIPSAESQNLLDRVIGFYVEQRYRLLERRSGAMPFSLDEITITLGQVAMQDMQKLHSVNLLSVEDFSNVVLTNRVQDFIDTMIQLGLLVYRGEGQLGFTHRLIQDYFYGRWVAQLDNLQFARSYFEALMWWGRYVHFPFCESLIVAWSTMKHEPKAIEIGNIIKAFREAYPPGALTIKSTSGDWLAVRTALQKLYALFELDGNPLLMDEPKQALRMATQEFMAESYRYASTPDFATAEAIYKQSVRVFLQQDSLWDAAFQSGYIADLCTQAGRIEDAIRHAQEAKRMAFEYARENNEKDIKEILSLNDFLLARAYLHLGQIEAAGDAVGKAVFWAFAQLVDPGPPDTYTVKWYDDTCTDSTGI